MQRPGKSLLRGRTSTDDRPTDQQTFAARDQLIKGGPAADEPTANSGRPLKFSVQSMQHESRPLEMARRGSANASTLML